METSEMLSFYICLQHNNFISIKQLALSRRIIDYKIVVLGYRAVVVRVKTFVKRFGFNWFLWKNSTKQYLLSFCEIFEERFSLMITSTVETETMHKSLNSNDHGSIPQNNNFIY